jgi:hypothetical protein
MAVKSGNLGRREFVLAGSAAIATPLLINTAGAATAESPVAKKETKKETYSISRMLKNSPFEANFAR